MTARVRPISHVRFGALVLISATLLFSSQLALAQFSQQGPKLVGTGAIGLAEQGYSIALSGDGNTPIVGGLSDSSGIGAARVFIRNPAWSPPYAAIDGCRSRSASPRR
jgi:hypothetical protein